MMPSTNTKSLVSKREEQKHLPQRPLLVHCRWLRLCFRDAQLFVTATAAENVCNSFKLDISWSDRLASSPSLSRCSDCRCSDSPRLNVFTPLFASFRRDMVVYAMPWNIFACRAMPWFEDSSTILWPCTGFRREQVSKEWLSDTHHWPLHRENENKVTCWCYSPVVLGTMHGTMAWLCQWPYLLFASRTAVLRPIATPSAARCSSRD